jgi:hypothetical protein
VIIRASTTKFISLVGWKICGPRCNPLSICNIRSLFPDVGTQYGLAAVAQIVPFYSRNRTNARTDPPILDLERLQAPSEKALLAYKPSADLISLSLAVADERISAAHVGQ